MVVDTAFFDKLTAIRHHLHQYPELSGQEFETTAFIKKILQEHHISIVETTLKTGVIAEIGTKEEVIIGLRADIDALPILEATNLDYASVNAGAMHACGHDFHTTSLLGAAILLKQYEDQLPGKVYLIFQPAEEIFQGAKEVIDVLDFSHWSGLVGFHNSPDLPLGAISARLSRQMASVDRFHVIIHGTGTHAAHPDQGNDPIVTGSQIITNLQAIISRHVPASEQAVLSITHVEAGSTWNVIPDTFQFEGTLRTFDETVRETIIQQTKKIIQNTADNYNQTVTIDWITGPGPVNNDEALYQLITPAVTSIGTEFIAAKSNLGGEDFAFYQEHVATYFASIGTGKGIPLHHPAFLIDDHALTYSVHYYLKAVETLLQINLGVI